MDPHFDGVLFQTHAAELERRMRYPFPPFAVLDVRPPAAFARGHLPGAINTAPAALASALPPGVAPGVEVFVVGSGPEEPALRPASLALMRAGVRRIVEFTGGMLEWEEHGGALATESGERRAA